MRLARICLHSGEGRGFNPADLAALQQDKNPCATRNPRGWHIHQVSCDVSDQRSASQRNPSPGPQAGGDAVPWERAVGFG
jgi:hypothetical protein